MTHQLDEARSHVHCGGCGAPLEPYTKERETEVMEERLQHVKECPARVGSQ